MLSEIIKTLNDAYGGDWNEEDKVHVANVIKRGEENEEMRASFTSPNSESNRRFVFEKALNEILLGYVNDNFEFYKKATQGQEKQVIMDLLYEHFRGKYGSV